MNSALRRGSCAQDDAAGTAQHGQTTIVTTLAGIDAAVMSPASVEQSADVKVKARTLRAALTCYARRRIRTPCPPPQWHCAEMRSMDGSVVRTCGRAAQVDEDVRPLLVLACTCGTHCALRMNV